ncbi:MAG: molybdopterin-guanine dinucleotide biosynthesis protein B [Planctomycetaceae bacterium]
MKQVPRVHIVGRKNAGKTTLVCDLVQRLTQAGLQVATIKHTHHRHELDTPGKDSHRHRQAGAAAVGILSPGMTAAFIPGNRDVREDDRYEHFDVLFRDFDLILVEGDLHATARRIEVWRSALNELPYASSDQQIQAVVSDDEPVVDCPVMPRSDLNPLIDHILSR